MREDINQKIVLVSIALTLIIMFLVIGYFYPIDHWCECEKGIATVMTSQFYWNYKNMSCEKICNSEQEELRRLK